jgi:hypothetical protein
MGVKTSLMHENEIQRLWLFQNQVLGRIHRPNNEVTGACIQLHSKNFIIRSLHQTVSVIKQKEWNGQDG